MVRDTQSKVPVVAPAFWISKIAATTLGETGGDAVSMSMKFGYLLATGVFAVVFFIAFALEVLARRYHPFNYWFVIVATTTIGTTISDYLGRTAGLGYPLASLLLFTVVLVVLEPGNSAPEVYPSHTSLIGKQRSFVGPRSWLQTPSVPLLATIWPIQRVSVVKVARWYSAD
jgi:hypothetical protein